MKVDKENANKVGKELCGGRNNHRRADINERVTTQESWEREKREKDTLGKKRDKTREETAVKSCGIFQN